MAKSKTPTSPEDRESLVLVETSLYINPRGRSVLTGTFVRGGTAVPFKYDLLDSDIPKIKSFMTELLSDHYVL